MAVEPEYSGITIDQHQVTGDCITCLDSKSSLGSQEIQRAVNNNT